MNHWRRVLGGPTYQEVFGLLGENKMLGLPLPNRDATFFRNSPEGGFFDGVHQMEDRARLNAFRPPQIV